MNKIFVIAGTYDQYKVFAKQLADAMNEEGLPVNRLDIVYISGPDTLKGYSNPWGYKVGTWAYRKDIKEIILQISLAGSSYREDFIEVRL